MFRKLKETVVAVHRNEEGQGMAEYGLLLALIALAVIAGLVALGSKLSKKFTDVNNALGN